LSGINVYDFGVPVSTLALVDVPLVAGVLDVPAVPDVPGLAGVAGLFGAAFVSAPVGVDVVVASISVKPTPAVLPDVPTVPVWDSAAPGTRQPTSVTGDPPLSLLPTLAGVPS
jgi:hypothetical protein